MLLLRDQVSTAMNARALPPRPPRPLSNSAEDAAPSALEALTVCNGACSFNDGFGGGSEVTENLGYNTCRESSDHAVFNSWDRQPFLTDVGQKAPEPDLNPAYNTIARNFFIGNKIVTCCADLPNGTPHRERTTEFSVLVLVLGRKLRSVNGH